MLRITATTEGSRTRIALAGRLAGLWVDQLRESWLRETARCEPASIQIDLGDVVFVDDAGKQLLRSLHEQGASLSAANLLVSALLEEIRCTRRGSGPASGAAR
jgi:anti-anti-sigma regulatory factor